jgi:hypothetical protein
MANNRIFYAIQVVKVNSCTYDATSGSTEYNSSEVVLNGVQSVGITTNFNLEQVFQLGQLELYENVEEVPDVEVTISKLLDGTQLAYNAVSDGKTTGSSNEASLTNLSNRRADVAIGIWDDTDTLTAGAASYYVVCTGMYVSSVSYNFVTDGNFTEDVTMVGNHKKWSNTDGGGINANFVNGIPTAETATVGRRAAFRTDLSTIATGLIPDTGAHFQSITVSTTLGRESINELGTRSPYYRYINFPVEVTAEVEVIATSGDGVNADDFGTLTGCGQAAGSNLSNEVIEIFVCDSSSEDAIDYHFNLGNKNKLTSVNYTGGDTGGGNASITYSFQSFNVFEVSGTTS